MQARQILEQTGCYNSKEMGYARQCMAKYAKLLQPAHKKDPINNPYIRKNTALLLENQVSELKEDTTSQNLAYFPQYMLPIIRRVWPNLIANQIVSVQPMTSPAAGVFYYERKYSDRKGSMVTPNGPALAPTAKNYDGELTAGTNMAQNFGMYYSSEFINYDAVCTDTGTSTAALTNASTNCRVTEWGPIRDNGVLGQRTFSVKAFYRVKDAAGTGTLNIVATMDNSGNLVDNQPTPKVVGTFNIANGQWAITGYSEAGAAASFVDNTVIYFQYYVDWERVHQTSGASIPSVELSITMETLRAESRNLKAKWHIDAVEDMKAQNGLDAEQEIVTMFSNEVMLEVDREVIDLLIQQAGHTASYTYASTTPGEIEAIRRILTQISAVSARIHKTSGRAPANFIVTSPAVVSLLDQLSTHGDYASIEQEIVGADYGLTTADYGISRVGTLLKKWAVFCDPYMQEDKILVGLKGKTVMDAGCVYAPYVPLMITPTFFDPDDNTYRRGIRTRYALKMLRPEYYGVITVTDLPTVVSN